MRWVLIVVGALSGVAPGVFGAPILSSYPRASEGAFSLNGNPVINVATGFTMGGTAFDLTSAKVQFSAVGIAQFPTSKIAVDLYGGNSAAPSGSALVSFVIPPGTISGGATDVTMTPATPFNLHASTSYWLVMRATPDVEGNLGVNASSVAPTGLSATYAGTTQDGNLPPTTSKGTAVIFEINGDVPEPGGCGILAVAGAGVALRRGRRR